LIGSTRDFVHTFSSVIIYSDFYPLVTGSSESLGNEIVISLLRGRQICF